MQYRDLKPFKHGKYLTAQRLNYKWRYLDNISYMIDRTFRIVTQQVTNTIFPALIHIIGDGFIYWGVQKKFQE